MMNKKAYAKVPSPTKKKGAMKTPTKKPMKK